MSDLSPCCNAPWKGYGVTGANGVMNVYEGCSKCGKPMNDNEWDYLEEQLKYGLGPEVPIRKELEVIHRELSEILQVLNVGTVLEAIQKDIGEIKNMFKLFYNHERGISDG